MIVPADEETLERLVGSSTFARGYGYARSGAVRSCMWSSDGTHVIGQVQGGVSKPYVVAVTVTRSPSNRLLIFDATCTCPVEVNCKHAVALLLTDDPAFRWHQDRSLADFESGDGLSMATSVAAVADLAQSQRHSGSKSSHWTDSLKILLESDEHLADEFDVQEIGLQFELIRQGSAPREGNPGIRVRPVIPGRNGNWVRSGISWANLDYIHYRMSRTPRSMERLLLVRELLALSRVAGRRSGYGRADEVVMLEGINSRRLWDLLGEARALGLPLLLSGRNPEPITLASKPLAVTLDVIRGGSGIRVELRIGTDDVSLSLENSLFIGSPAHAVAWWHEPPTSQSRAHGLAIAALSHSIDENLQGVFAMERLTVPRHDEARFMSEYVPKLRRRVEVVSSDGSVDLPENLSTILVLRVRAGDSHRIGLAWVRSVEGGVWLEELSSRSDRALLSAVGDPVMAAVGDVVRSIPGLIERTPFGEHLAPTAELEGMTAVRFVTELLPALESVEGVAIERIGTFAEYREAADVPQVRLSGSESLDTDWFDLTVKVTVGREEVPFTTLFRALASGDSHLILPSGTFFSLDDERLRELAQLIIEARALHEMPGDGIRLSRFQASLWEDFERLGVLSAQARQWESTVRALIDANDRTEYAAPKSLCATLRPYQVEGFNWLAYLYENRLGGVLADDMGLGKTLQALALMCHARERDRTTEPFLVVAPTSVVGNWVDECHRFAPDLSVVTISETGRRREATLRELATGTDVVVTSYSLFRLEYAEYTLVDWSGLFLDEAQFAKNRLSQTYQKAKTLPVSFKVAMSGTPIENNLMELWSLLSIAAPGLFSGHDRFAQYYQVPIEKHADVERMAQLRRRIRPLLLRRTKEQVARDLPDKQEQVLELELNSKHRRVYQRYLQRERQKVLGLLDEMSTNRFEIFRSLTLLRQASLDVSLVDAKHVGVSSTKLDALMEMLDDIVSDGHRVLVFSQFTRFLETARSRIRSAGIDHCYLDGRTRNRPAVIAEFREGRAPVFLISLKAGGFGLNLTEADYCILLDPWWNPATEAQAVDRVHRIGQARKVMVYRLVARDTIEEKVMTLKAKKAALFANVLDGGGFEYGAMTAADIRDLLD